MLVAFGVCALFNLSVYAYFWRRCALFIIRLLGPEPRARWTLQFIEPDDSLFPWLESRPINVLYVLEIYVGQPNIIALRHESSLSEICGVKQQKLRKVYFNLAESV